MLPLHLSRVPLFLSCPLAPILDPVHRPNKLDKIGMDGVINELENQEFSKRSIDLLIPFLDNKGSFKSKIDFLSRKLKDIEVLSSLVRISFGR